MYWIPLLVVSRLSYTADFSNVLESCVAELWWIVTLHRLTSHTKRCWIHLSRNVAVRHSLSWVTLGRGLTVWPEAELKENLGADIHHHIFTYSQRWEDKRRKDYVLTLDAVRLICHVPRSFETVSLQIMTSKQHCSCNRIIIIVTFLLLIFTSSKILLWSHMYCVLLLLKKKRWRELNWYCVP